MVCQLLRAARPYQWIKNLLLYAGFLFTLGAGDTLPAFIRASIGVLIFCCLSGSAYIVNDVLDAESDRRHPDKKRRPIASGALPPAIALMTAIILGLAALIGAILMDRGFGLIAVFYLCLTLSYSAFLKRVVLLDVIVLALGYVVRAVAGAVIIHVPASFWLALCTMLLALFIGLCKRRAELSSSRQGAPVREVLAEYSLPLLDQMISVVTASALLAYALYTYFTPTGVVALPAWRFEHHLLTFTIPFVVYGIYRFLFLVYQRNEGESPEALFLHDAPLRFNTLLWAIACAAARIAGGLA